MRKALLLALLILVLVSVAAGCQNLPPEIPAFIAGATDTPTSSPESTQECDDHATEMALDGPTKAPLIGETFLAKVTLSNVGQCGSVGLPQYTLSLDTDASSPILAPGTPEPVVHSLGLSPGDPDQAIFACQVVSSGVVTITANTSFEVHL